jgi:ribosomal protein S18 acetylase RimI-like enzyme
MLTNKSLVLRKFREKDLDECLQLGRQMVDYHRQIYEDDSIPYDDKKLREKLKRTGEKYVKMVAEEENKIVGLLILEIKGRSCEIDYIIVDKDRRGKGIGKALMNYAKETALKCVEIILRFAARNIEAFRFYHNNGLNCLGMVEVFMPLTEEGKNRWYKKKGKRTHFLGLECYY